MNPVTVTLGANEAFTFSPGGSGSQLTETANYRWSINTDTPGTQTLTPASPGASVTNTLTLSSSGPNVLRVWAYDQAGNSAFSLFLMTADGFQPARWSLDGATAPSVPDPVCVPTGTGPAVTSLAWTGGVTSAPGHKNTAVSTDRALHFAGAGMAASTGAAPVSNAAAGSLQNYTVMGWVHVDPSVLDETGAGSPKLVGGTRIAFGIDGPSGSAITVGLAADPGTVSGEPGAARFTATMNGTGTAFAPIMDITSQVWAEDWYQVSVAVEPGQDLLELDIAADDTSLGGLQPPVTTSDNWASTFVTHTLKNSETKDRRDLA